MSMRTSKVLWILSTVIVMSGCGPTKRGLESRENARNRMDAVGANVSYEQACQAFDSGHFEKALRDINATIERYPENASYHILQGRVFLETMRLEQSLRSFLTAQEKGVDNPEAHYYAGIVFQRWSDDEQAFEQYNKASELDEKNVHYLLAAAESLVALGEFELARQLIAPKLEYFEHNSALKQLQAQVAFLQDKPEEATQLYAEARLLNPDDETLLEEMAWAQYASGRYEDCCESIRYLEHTSQVKRPDLKRLEAQCLVMVGRSMEARDIYVQLSRRYPEDQDLWIELGTVCWEMGDDRRLEESANHLIEIAPNRYEGYLMKAMFEKHLDNRPEAIRHLRKATELATNTAIPHLLLGQMLEEHGDTEEALLVYQAGLRAEPDNVEARVLHERLAATRKVSSVPTDQE